MSFSKYEIQFTSTPTFPTGKLYHQTFFESINHLIIPSRGSILTSKNKSKLVTPPIYLLQSETC